MTRTHCLVKLTGRMRSLLHLHVVTSRHIYKCLHSLHRCSRDIHACLAEQGSDCLPVAVPLSAGLAPAAALFGRGRRTRRGSSLLGCRTHRVETATAVAAARAPAGVLLPPGSLCLRRRRCCIICTDPAPGPRCTLKKINLNSTPFEGSIQAEALAQPAR